MSLSHLLFHFIHCKQALFYIVGTISKLLTVDYVMAFINRPSVTRILVKNDASCLLLMCIELVR